MVITHPHSHLVSPSLTHTHSSSGIPVNHARQTIKALQESPGLKGMVFSVIEHDPRECLDPKLIPSLPLGTRHTLFKEYKYLTNNVDEVSSLSQHRFFIGYTYIHEDKPHIHTYVHTYPKIL